MQNKKIIFSMKNANPFVSFPGVSRPKALYEYYKAWFMTFSKQNTLSIYLGYFEILVR